MDRILKPKKADGAKLNTWIVDVDGSILANNVMFKNSFAVRFTSDTHETLSITDERSGVQFNVPFKMIQEMIDNARKEWKVKKQS